MLDELKEFLKDFISKLLDDEPKKVVAPKKEEPASFNYASPGFSFQYLICKKYGIKPLSSFAEKQFEKAYSSEFDKNFIPIIEEVFDSLKATPIACTTHTRTIEGIVPYNFILSNKTTLSVRINIGYGMVAPRRVGQAGFSVLNDYFGEILGHKINNQEDIKELIENNIDDALPIFVDNLFDADYILWVFWDRKNECFKYHLLKGNELVNITYDKDKFSFSRYGDEWVESTRLRYEGKSIAEIQIHKNRTFKFRFVMRNIIPLLVEKEINNETLGITTEKAICDKFGIKCPPSFMRRYSVEMEVKVRPAIDEAFKYLPNAIEHTGSTPGERGGESKCSYDFILDGDKTLSVKSNIGKMVCPPEVGQPAASTCYLYFSDLIEETYIDGPIYKKMVFNSIDKMLPRFIEHMFDSNYLLWVYLKKGKYEYKILDMDYAKNIEWDFSKISFTKRTIEDWNESNTLKYDGISIGEFQVHKNRDCYKFRFNFPNFIKVVEMLKK